MNLCTDQLALLLAGPGQIRAVSFHAADPRASNLATAARGLPASSGTAEEMVLHDPDLVLAGSYDDRASLEMLARLGIRVELFPPAASIAEVIAQIRRMGTLLGRPERAAAVVAELEAELRGLAARAAALPRRDAAFYEANGYTFGAGTLEHEVLTRAGLDNAAAALGLTGAARLPLEMLVTARPFLVRSRGAHSSGPAMATAAPAHPVLAALAAEEGSAVLEERWLACGTPHVAEAIAALIAAREE